MATMRALQDRSRYSRRCRAIVERDTTAALAAVRRTAHSVAGHSVNNGNHVAGRETESRQDKGFWKTEILRYTAKVTRPIARRSLIAGMGCRQVKKTQLTVVR
jgi:hypothetical protein